jgi:hypothetical protein
MSEKETLLNKRRKAVSQGVGVSIVGSWSQYRSEASRRCRSGSIRPNFREHYRAFADLISAQNNHFPLPFWHIFPTIHGKSVPLHGFCANRNHLTDNYQLQTAN